MTIMNRMGKGLIHPNGSCYKRIAGTWNSGRQQRHSCCNFGLRIFGADLLLVFQIQLVEEVLNILNSLRRGGMPINRGTPIFLNAERISERIVGC